MSQTKRKFSAAELVPGQAYTVIADFQDFDGMTHSVGERWRYVGKNFLPYEDGLTLTVERDGQVSQVRRQWRDESQGQLLDNFSRFVVES